MVRRNTREGERKAIRTRGGKVSAVELVKRFTN